MKCLLCGKTLNKDQILYNHIFSICESCNIYFVKKDYIDSLIKQIFKYYKFKNDRHFQIFLSKVLIQNKDRQYKIINYNNKCAITDCTKNCDLLEYKYNGFTFYYCNFIDYYLINIDKIKKFIHKQYRISLFYVYKEIIFNKIKRLFVKE